MPVRDCDTKFPILLLHGLGCHDYSPFRYFGRIPETLRAHGAVVYLGGQEASATTEHNALQLRARLLAILRRERCEKVNIIAHSKGGLEARYLISTLQMAQHVASLTTVSTPHHGLRSVDNWAEKEHLLRMVSNVVDAAWYLTGDRASDFASVVKSLRTGDMTAFNEANPNDSRVFYQSWAAALRGAQEDRILSITGKFFQRADGENDGLVAAASAKWGEFRGVVAQTSHRDVVDSRERDRQDLDILGFYVTLVQDLKRRGY